MRDVPPTESADEAASPPSEPVALSAAFLDAVRTDEAVAIHLDALAVLPESELTTLPPAAARAFWLNVYNAATQRALDRGLVDYEDRRAFFGEPCINVSTTPLSLDAIEHGILRGRQSKFGGGYLPRLTGSGFERRHALEREFRIHFALNCGAVSCPAIASYDAENLDSALEEATQRYLERTVQYDAATNTARVPRVCLWFRGDFGGKRGIQQMLEAYDIVPPGARPSLRYAEWDWTRDPDDYVQKN